MRTQKIEEKQSPSKKIRKGDSVVVITGNDRGRVGIVKSTNGEKVIVHGINMRKKHVKPTQNAPKGRIVDMECAIHVSNVKICVDEERGVRLKVRTNEDGQRHFVYKNGDEEVVYRSVKKPK
ncbi:MAG: 50S ribosomal protein L24 [Chlamydiales bacterium]